MTKMLEDTTNYRHLAVKVVPKADEHMKVIL